MTNEACTQIERAEKLARELGVVHRRDLVSSGLPPVYLARLARAGTLDRLAPGVYMHPEADLGAHVELIVAAKRVPGAVIFGPSALSVHELTSQLPHVVTIAVERGRRAPQFEWPTVRTFRLSGPSFSTGIEERALHARASVPIYSIAKTIADLFKFRRRFGLDVALEALEEGWARGLFTARELDECARACRVRNVMRPYLEALLS